jgi:hypothetical protein
LVNLVRAYGANLARTGVGEVRLTVPDFVAKFKDRLVAKEFQVCLVDLMGQNRSQVAQ